jgi:hypothetical protein
LGDVSPPGRISRSIRRKKPVEFAAAALAVVVPGDKVAAGAAAGGATTGGAGVGAGVADEITAGADIGPMTAISALAARPATT